MTRDGQEDQMSCMQYRSRRVNHSDDLLCCNFFEDGWRRAKD